MQIVENKSLEKLNTFGIDVKARFYTTIRSIEELRTISESDIYRNNDLFVLGGGSNILLTQDLNSLVIKNDIKGIEIISEDENSVELMVGSGENWHEFVMFCVKNGYGGIENLSLIPGNVGAAPMQNIGAYGVEIKDTFQSLNAFHIQSGEVHHFNNNDCCFGYRESVFKNKLKGEYIILSIVLKLNKKPNINSSYGDIEKKLSEWKISNPTIKDISDAVISIRETKLPDPNKIGNSGSFFKNPIITNEAFKVLIEKYPNAIHYKVDDKHVKVAAGWLIDNAGWKGKTFKNYGVHKKQALVLVNYGGAKGSDVNDLSNMILEDIYKKYKIRLEKEVNIL
mgnify:CR=1 FL=1